MTDEFDQIFRGTTGLADDFDCVFRKPAFLRNPTYTDSDGVPQLVLSVDFHTDSADIGQNGVLEDQLLTIGKGWETEDGGKSVVHTSGKARGFNVSTYAQLILTRLLELDEQKVKDHYAQVKVGPQHAEFWDGLSVHLNMEKTGEGQYAKDRLLPTEFHGWVDEGAASGSGGKAPAKKAPAKKAASTKAKAKPAPEAEPETEENVAEENTPSDATTPYLTAKAQVDAGIISQLETIAAESGTADEFMERAYAEVDGIDDDENIQLLVDDVDSDESIWAEACA